MAKKMDIDGYIADISTRKQSKMNLEYGHMFLTSLYEESKLGDWKPLRKHNLGDYLSIPRFSYEG